MPFTTPATVASAANTGYEATFGIGTGSPPTYPVISEITDFEVTPFSMTEVPTTTLLSPLNTEEFIPSMLKPGKLTFKGNFTGAASQLQITTLAQAQTIFPMEILAPVNLRTQTYTFNGKGFFTSYKLNFANNKAIGYDAEIQLTGAYTEVVA